MKKASILWLVMSVVQFLAIFAGFQVWFQWHWALSLIAAFLIGYIPLVGSVVGVMGAMKGWGWGFLPAFLLFFWQYVLMLILILLSARSSKK